MRQSTLDLDRVRAVGRLELVTPKWSCVLAQAPMVASQELRFTFYLILTTLTNTSQSSRTH